MSPAPRQPHHPTARLSSAPDEVRVPCGESSTGPWVLPPTAVEFWDNRRTTEKCPEPALTDPGLPHFDQTERGEAIMAVSQATQAIPPSGEIPLTLYAKRMARVDGCPNLCGYLLPNLVTSNEPGRFYAHYTCPDCGHDWITGWRDDA